MNEKDDEIEKIKEEAKKKMDALKERHRAMLKKATEAGPDFEPAGPLAGPIK